MIKVSGFDLCLVRYLEKGSEMPCVMRSRRFALIRMALWDEVVGFISGQIHSAAESLHRWGAWWLELE